MSNFQMTIPWNVIRDKIVEKLTGMIAESFGEAIANRFKQNIKVEIAFGEFDTVFDKKQPDMMAWGDYFNSIGVSEGKKQTDGNYEISIYSTDEKAEDIEWGTSPDEEAGLTDAEIIQWARHEKIPNPVVVGTRIAMAIRGELWDSEGISGGQYPKAIFGTAIGKTKAQNSFIKSDGLRLIRKKKTDFTISGS